MSDDKSQLKTLANTILKSADPAARKEALLEIRKFDDPRVMELLQHVSAKDRDKSVRDLAGNLLVKKKVQGLQASADEPILSPPSRPSTASGWTCASCGGENSGENRCRFCGAARTQTSTSQAVIHPHSDRPPPGETVFYLYPANQKFVEGKTKRVASSYGGFSNFGCMILFFIPFILVGIGFMGYAIYETYKATVLQSAGITTQGQFINRRISEDDDSTSYYVTYRFNHQNQAYTHEQSVNYGLYNEAGETGARVKVVYLPGNPSISAIAGENKLPLAFLGFGLCWNVFVIPVVFFTIRNYRRTRFLAQNGRVIYGQITGASADTDSDGDLRLKIVYRFTTPETRQSISKTETATRNDLKSKPLPPMGTPVAILYSDPRQFQLL